MMSATEVANDAMIRGFFHAWERRDTDHVVASFTDDAVYHNISLEPLVGVAAIRDFVAGREGMPPPRCDIRRQLVSGNVVMNERVDRFVMGPKKIELPVAGVFEVHGGKISAWRDYFDLTTFTKQMG